MDNQKINQRYKITYKPTNESINIRLNSKNGVGVLEAVKEEFEFKFGIIDEDRSNYEVARINLEVIKLPEPQKIAQLLTKTSIQLPIDVLRELNLEGSSKGIKPIFINSDKVKSPVTQPKPIIQSLSIKKGDKVQLSDGREGYIVKYSSNNDIKIFTEGELNQGLFKKNIHPFNIQVHKELIKQII